MRFSSRSTRTRKPSATEEEPTFSARKSPSRRTPTRSTTTTIATTDKTGKTRAAKALQPEFDAATNALGDVDARTYFDTVLKKYVGRPGSGSNRRRTRSDSEVPDVKPMKVKKMNVEETILEVDEETDARTTRGRQKASTQATEEGTSAAQSPSRSRRASSVTIGETTPGRRRRTSGSSVSSVGTSSTSKSPSRRGRPRGIETIPE
ncbi:unnamed protein product [Strongylus vulgaris]|uniref:Uncharacterized protein n=1 Tax=Strongylus vulgaris TaxID=40348 RepID=A0A3P7IRL6_STRVU|nr:unnamed protein product [Strongylus vulgaris]